jgi:hypothetical protein
MKKDGKGKGKEWDERKEEAIVWNRGSTVEVLCTKKVGVRKIGLTPGGFILPTRSSVYSLQNAPFSSSPPTLHPLHCLTRASNQPRAAHSQSKHSLYQLHRRVELPLPSLTVTVTSYSIPSSLRPKGVRPKDGTLELKET